MRQKSQNYPRVSYGELSFAEVMTPKRIDRFWRKVDRAGLGLCWPWRAGRNGGGYGLFQGSVAYRGYSFLAHRLVFWLTHGRDPIRVVRHTCDNPCCCNPAHLLEGTHADNAADMIARGRQVIVKGKRGPQPRYRLVAREAWRLRYEDRWPVRQIAERLGVDKATVIRWTRQGA